MLTQALLSCGGVTDSALQTDFGVTWLMLVTPIRPIVAMVLSILARLGSRALCDRVDNFGVPPEALRRGRNRRGKTLYISERVVL